MREKLAKNEGTREIYSEPFDFPFPLFRRSPTAQLLGITRQTCFLFEHVWAP